MKRIVVNVNFEFAKQFKDTTGVEFIEAIYQVLIGKFFESHVTIVHRDDYNFEVDVDTDDVAKDIGTGELVDFVLDQLGVKDFNGKGFVISCFIRTPSLFELPKIGGSKFEKSIVKIKGLNEYLVEKIVGQDFAVNTVVNGFIETATFKSKSETKPLLTFFFAGAENTGKSALALETVNYLKMPFVVFNSTDYNDINRFFNRLSKFITTNPNGAVIFNDCESFTIDIMALLYGAYTTGEYYGLSFRNLTIFFTTNCGRSLYENTPRKNLSHISKQDILDACSRDKDKLTGSPCFHPLFLKVLQNEHVVMFNHLQTINYQFLIAQHIDEYRDTFAKNTGIEITLDSFELSRFVIFNNPDETDIKKLKKAAEDLFVGEIEYIIKQNGKGDDKSLLLSLNKIVVDIDLKGAEKPVKDLFKDRTYNVLVACSEKEKELLETIKTDGYKFVFVSSLLETKKAIKKDIDLVLVDPLFGIRDEVLPVDVEDYNSTGNDIFEYLNKFYSRIPLDIISNDRYGKNINSYQTLVNKGVNDIVFYSTDNLEPLDVTVIATVKSFELDHDVNALRRSNMHVEYNAKQEIKNDVATISLTKLGLRPVAIENYNNKDSSVRRIKSLDDVFGNQICKEALRGFGQYLSSTSEYLEEGKLPPKLIIINGRNGSGKTTLIRALAEETSSSIITIDVKEFFVNRLDYVDEMKEAFKKARYASPAIIHFKNINILFGGYENLDSIRALEAINAEIAFTTNDYLHPVMIIGECDPNYSVSRKLTETATRYFVLPKPSIADVELYVKKYLSERNITTVSEKAIHNFALRIGFGNIGDAKKILDFALSNAGGKGLTDAVLKDSFDSLFYGDVDLRHRSEHDLRTTSYHEIGHYILLRLFGDRSPFVTIVPRGYYNGYTANQFKDESKHVTRQDMLDDICVSFGGRAAEVILNGEDRGITTGISGDIANATSVALSMVAYCAMGTKLAAIVDDLPDYLRYQSPDIYNDVNAILAKEYERALRLIKLNHDSLVKLGEALLKNRSMTGDELEELLPDDKLVRE